MAEVVCFDDVGCVLGVFGWLECGVEVWDGADEPVFLAGVVVVFFFGYLSVGCG